MVLLVAVMVVLVLIKTALLYSWVPTVVIMAASITVVPEPDVTKVVALMLPRIVKMSEPVLETPKYANGMVAPTAPEIMKLPRPG